MMKLIKFTVIILALHIVSINASAQGFLDNLLGNAANTLNNLNEQRISKPVKVRLTGTIEGEVKMTIGNTGRTEIITELPYVFKVSKKELPLKLTFSSNNNCAYKDIQIPKKPTDNIGHVYLLKKETQQGYYYAQNQAPQQAQQQNAPVEPKKDITMFDKNSAINKAPITKIKNENTFAVIIANEEYEMAGKVEMANNDGLAMKEYFVKTFGLSENQVLYYPNATYGKMNKAINDIKDIAEAFEGDINLLFYYAGHGIPDNSTKDAYLMPIDADGSDVSVCYSLKKLYKEIDDMKLKQCVVFLDACFSGAKRDGDMVVAARGVAIKPKEEKPTGNTIVFTAASDEETAFAYDDQKHGLFTYFLLKKFQEKKNNVSIGELAEYISKNVSRQSILINGKKQTPAILVPQSMGANWKSRKLIGK
ncbi:MAG: caspase family protein [Bacteroidaceae bacterium]|nr:caspase family protein [Bacteroidaceae bacterium]